MSQSDSSQEDFIHPAIMTYLADLTMSGRRKLKVGELDDWYLRFDQAGLQEQMRVSDPC